MSNTQWIETLGTVLSIGGLFWGGKKTTASSQAKLIAPEKGQDVSSSKKIFLNDTVVPTDKPEREANVVVLGEAAQSSTGEGLKKKVGNNTMEMKSHGGFVVLDCEGMIVKSRDALGSVKEYMRDPDTNALMVRRFGVWTCPPGAALSKDGVLCWGDQFNSFEEHLDGKYIHRNLESGVTITTDKLNHIETVARRDGRVSTTITKEDVVEVSIWENTELVFHSETYKEGGAKDAKTREGTLSLKNVYRYEANYFAGRMLAETFAFSRPTGNYKGARMRLEIGSGALLLKDIQAIECAFTEDGSVTSTTYKMDSPTSFSIDIPKQKTTIENVMVVNSTELNGCPALVFVTKDNDEYIVFPGPTNAEKVTEVFHLIRKSQEHGGDIPDLLLR